METLSSCLHLDKVAKSMQGRNLVCFVSRDAQFLPHACRTWHSLQPRMKTRTKSGLMHTILLELGLMTLPDFTAAGKCVGLNLRGSAV